MIILSVKIIISTPSSVTNDFMAPLLLKKCFQFIHCQIWRWNLYSFTSWNHRSHPFRFDNQSVPLNTHLSTKKIKILQKEVCKSLQLSPLTPGASGSNYFKMEFGIRHLRGRSSPPSVPLIPTFRPNKGLRQSFNPLDVEKGPKTISTSQNLAILSDLLNCASVKRFVVDYQLLTAVPVNNLEQSFPEHFRRRIFINSKTSLSRWS